MPVVKWKSITLVVVSGIILGAILMLGIVAFAKWAGFTTGDFLSLSQLGVDLCMVPITVIGFIIVFLEFRKSEIKPVVDLFFEGNVKETTLTKPKRSSTFHPPLVLPC